MSIKRPNRIILSTLVAFLMVMGVSATAISLTHGKHHRARHPHAIPSTSDSLPAAGPSSAASAGAHPRHHRRHGKPHGSPSPSELPSSTSTTSGDTDPSASPSGGSSGSGSGPTKTPKPGSTSSPNTSLRGCAAKPSSCGYPDATNAGVPAGTTLRKSGSVNADTAGQVIDGLDITGEINVTAPNVVIKNTRVSARNGDWVIILRAGARNLTIQDSEIMSPADATVDNACIFNITDEKPTMLRLNIHGCSAGVSSGGGLLQDSYVHDPGFTPGLSHITLVASNGGGGFTVRHNTILNPHDQTAAIAFYQDFGVQKDDLVENNLLAGGGYVVYGGNGEKGTATNIRFLNNRFSRTFYPNGGYFGYVASFSPNNPGNAWSGNFWDDTLQALGS
ncbi:MAG: hypothetical protein JWO46_3117 [Nocardioidaceae bacterium]|nr:hypothetical protein [Nocardioidaceae bacterium]